MTNTRALGFLSLALLVVSVIWIALTFADAVRTGAVDTLDQALAVAEEPDWVFKLNYLNATILTALAVGFMAALYVYCRPHLPDWAAMIGLIFVPIYGTLNLVVYLSQIAILPRLVALHQVAGYEAAARLLTGLFVHLWDGSVVAVLNTLAYALLGIPSILFGVVLYRQGGALRAGGLLLILSAIGCVVSFIGLLLQSPTLAPGLMIGGGLFLLSFAPLSWGFLKAAAARA